MKRFIAVITISIVLTVAAKAQRGNVDWVTDNADAQRSSWIRADAKISKEAMLKKDDPQNAFQFLWKMKTKNAPKQLNSLMPPSTLDRLIGYRGFRMLGFFGGSSDNIITLDTDLGRLEWEKHLKTNAPASVGTLACPGGMTTGVAKPTLAAIPPSPTGASGPGRSNPAKSAVGEPSQGAVTLANVRPNPPGPPPGSGGGANPMLPQQNRVNPANPPGGQLGAGPFLVYALASDGMLHSLHLSNGADYESPTKFVPPGANASGLVVIDYVAYVVTSNSCGGADNGVWALDLISKQVSTWKGNVVGSVGPVFGGDGTVYVATGSGGDKPNSIVALEAKTLKLKASFSAGAEFASTPVLFADKGKTLIAAATKDGKIHLLDSANLGAGALSSSASTGKELASGALASWQDRDGTRWILASIVGALPAGFTATSGAVTKGAVVAWKLVEQNGTPTFQPGWASRDLTSPLTPTIINNVVFVTSSGEFRASDKTPAAMRAARSGKAVVYALDGATGKELW
ncbi:MAG: hypothetical protein ACRD82_14535, partial [Blastocatellia bacterium]